MNATHRVRRVLVAIVLSAVAGGAVTVAVAAPAARTHRTAASRSTAKRTHRLVVARVTGLSGRRFYVKSHQRLIRLQVGARIFQHEFLVLGPATRARLTLKLDRRSPISNTANVLYIARFHTAAAPPVSTITPDWGLIGFGAKLRHHLLMPRGCSKSDRRPSPPIPTPGMRTPRAAVHTLARP